MMGLALSSEFQNTWPNNSRGKSLKDSMDAILSTYENLQAEYYPTMAFPVGKYLHALVNGQPIAVDNTVLKYVGRSAFTNSISSFYVTKAATDDEYSIVPESSLSLLARADTRRRLKRNLRPFGTTSRLIFCPKGEQLPMAKCSKIFSLECFACGYCLRISKKGGKKDKRPSWSFSSST